MQLDSVLVMHEQVADGWRPTPYSLQGEDAHNSAGAVLRAAATASHQASIRERLSFIIRPSNDFVIRVRSSTKSYAGVCWKL